MSNTPTFKQGWYQKESQHIPSPFYNQRPQNEVSLIVVHNISLPLGEFGKPYIEQLFTGTLNCQAHPSFSDLLGLEVSSHFLIQRSGLIQQFVSIDSRAWHAGVSCFQGKDNCNDYSVGIELEGSDFVPFTEAQYRSLIQLSEDLLLHYALDANHIVGHSDIAPGRKTDPGPFFDWEKLRKALS